MSAPDLDAYLAIWGDPEVTRFIGGKPSTREETWSRLLRNVGHWAEIGFGALGGLREGWRPVRGRRRLRQLQAGHRPAAGRRPGDRLVFSPSVTAEGLRYRGGGRGPGLGRSSISRIRAPSAIDPDNAPSLRLAEKVGYREYARADYRGPIILLVRFRCSDPAPSREVARHRRDGGVRRGQSPRSAPG